MIVTQCLNGEASEISFEGRDWGGMEDMNGIFQKGIYL